MVLQDYQGLLPAKFLLLLWYGVGRGSRVQQ